MAMHRRYQKQKYHILLGLANPFLFVGLVEVIDLKGRTAARMVKIMQSNERKTAKCTDFSGSTADSCSVD
jgi:hypothetical protein